VRATKKKKNKKEKATKNVSKCECGWKVLGAAVHTLIKTFGIHSIIEIPD